jgi:hypothetical protein
LFSVGFVPAPFVSLATAALITARNARAFSMVNPGALAGLALVRHTYEQKHTYTRTYVYNLTRTYVHSHT